jgi:hypothetical protein
MNPYTARPEIVTDEHLTFLNALRASGVTNMFGAGPYVEREFGLDRHEAKDVILYWMETFDARNPIA